MTVEPRSKLHTRLLLHQFCLTNCSQIEVSQTKLMQTKSHSKLHTKLHWLERLGLRQNFHLLLVFQLSTLQSCVQDDKAATSLVESSWLRPHFTSSIGACFWRLCYKWIFLPAQPKLYFISRYYIPILLNGLVKTIDWCHGFLVLLAILAQMTQCQH